MPSRFELYNKNRKVSRIHDFGRTACLVAVYLENDSFLTMYRLLSQPLLHSVALSDPRKGVNV
jgi:hypothetical protein